MENLPFANSAGALFADLYQLTMMQGLWATGNAEQPACFELFYRRAPEAGGYCVALGIDDALNALAGLAFSSQDLAYLADLKLFQNDFLEFLAQLRFTGAVRAVDDGTVVFPNEPILEVCAPLIQAQWIETLLLNIVNFQTLIGTKASRIVRSAGAQSVIEFGMRRAQGPNGALWVSKSAFAAGCVGTSNLEAGKQFAIPVYGTHAHSWVMSFPSELEAFRAYARVFPNHTSLLIDTYDTLEQGLPHAITVAKELASLGHQLHAVRLDSGDLAYLAKAVRRKLDAENLTGVKILASNDLDEYLINDLKSQGAPIDLFGVGTRLATAFQEPALGGVYKLVALQDRPGQWTPKIKVSSNPAKTTIPCRKQIWRWRSGGQFLGDALALLDDTAPDQMRHPDIDHKQTGLSPSELTPLLEKKMQNGQRFGARPTFAEIRQRVQQQLLGVPEETLRLKNPHTYRIGLSQPLWSERKRLIAEHAS